ncbi:MAG: DUF4168 domain-containing protein [Spirulina sp.]
MSGGQHGVRSEARSIEPSPLDRGHPYPRIRGSLGTLAAITRWIGTWVVAMVLSLWVAVGPGWAMGETSPSSLITNPETSVPTPPKAQPDASAVPSETVSCFVSAYLEVVKLIEAREQGLQSAETETESRQMQEEIQAEAVHLIQSHDLTLQAYWELLGLANSDPEFRERVLAQMEEASL